MWEVGPLVRLTERVTGKKVSLVSFEWYQDERTIYSSRGDLEGLLHELGHWVMANDIERQWPNLLLDEWETNNVDRYDWSDAPTWAKPPPGEVRSLFWNQYVRDQENRVARREQEAVFFQVQSLLGAKVHALTGSLSFSMVDVLTWLRTWSEGGGTYDRARDLLQDDNRRQECASRLEERMPYPEFLPDVRRALSECYIEENPP